DKSFVNREQLGSVLKVLWPAVAAVALMHFVGLYVASALYMGFYMRWVGRHSWVTVVAIALGIPIGSFLVFEKWFLVPMPKGPLEQWLGLWPRGIENPLLGLHIAIPRFNLFMAVVGILLGTIIGVLPGLGGANGVAILLPVTFTMPPTSAIILLTSIYWGALFGGAITSILFNIPGEPWSVATTFDGYPMARQGQGGQALTGAFTSSFIGAFFSIVLITLVAPLVASFALRFGPPEIFAVYFLAFSSFVGLGGGNPLKSRVSILLGFILAAVGLDIVTGQLRMTFGITDLMQGFDFIIA